MSKDFNKVPDGLDDKGRKAHEVIMSVLTAGGSTWTGGCRTFYSPKEWKALGDREGTDSKLIVVYDGGDVADYFTQTTRGNDGYIDKMTAALEKEGLYFMECSNVYGAVYEIEEQDQKA